MQMESIDKIIEKRINENNKINNYEEVGNLIKRKRKELSYTQESISRGICSISYLSKIENSQIKPNAMYVEDILERMEISKKNLLPTYHFREYLENTIKYFYFYDDKLLLDTLNDIKEVEANILVESIKFAYYIYHDNLENAEIIYNSIISIINNMEQFNLCVFLTLSGILYMKKNMYKKSLKFFENAKNLGFINPYLTGITELYSFEVKQLLEMKTSSYLNYENALKIFNDYLCFERIIEIKTKFAYFLSKENDYKNSLSTLEVIRINDFKKTKFINQYYLYLAKIHFNHGNYEKAFDNIYNIELNNKNIVEVLLLKYKCLKHLSRENDIMKEIKEIDISKLSSDDVISYNHFLLSEEGKNDELMNYVKNVALPYYLKSENIEKIKLFTCEIMNYCIEKSRYKDALACYKKQNKHIEKIH